MDFTGQFLAEVREIAASLDVGAIDRMALALAGVRSRGGRLFILGVGGSAANASHSVNDFRKIAGLETYAPTDNVSELTARTNDDGWATVFANWLKISRVNARDAVLVLSVGGGDLQRQVSPNLIAALDHAKSAGACVLGVVGRDGGYTAKVADVCIIVPTVNPMHVTPHTEAFQGVVCHLLVSHPALKQAATRWESLPRPRAVFLDRDGVLTRAFVREGKPYPPASLAEFELMPGAREALARLKERGFLLIVVTNQPDVARGTVDRAAVDQMHAQLRSWLPLDDLLACCHDDSDNCDCRKPLPGLLTSAASRYGIDLPASYMVGDRWRDVEAGSRAGARTIWIDSGYAERLPEPAPDARVKTLSEAVEWILRDCGERLHDEHARATSQTVR